MNVRDLESFRDYVANPRMLQIFEKTELPEGVCYIDTLNVSFLDGRSCGHETLIEASGLIFKSGNVEEYQFSECDISLNDFLSSHKNYVFLSDGSLFVSDELAEMELRTLIRNLQICEKLFSEMKCHEDMNIEPASLFYEKMKYLFKTKGKESPVLNKPSLDAQIANSAGKVKKSFELGAYINPDLQNGR